jgi:hypothetical protein
MAKFPHFRACGTLAAFNDPFVKFWLPSDERSSSWNLVLVWPNPGRARVSYLSVTPVKDELEMLGPASWGLMILAVGFYEHQIVSQNGPDRSPVMPHHGKAAAPFRPIGRECADDDMAAGPHGPQYACRISLAVGCLRQEMKGRSVVPEIISLLRIKARHIGSDPCHFGGLRPEPRFCGGKRLLRKIEDGQITKALGQ